MKRSIMAMTGHKTTQMVRRYIKEANIFKNNALNKIKNIDCEFYKTKSEDNQIYIQIELY